jgi:sterol O-acyltransferase
MFLFTVQTYVSSFEKHGYALSMAFARMFSQHAIGLLITDAVLVGSTAFCVLFAKALSKGWFKYYWTGLVIQHLFQTFMLASAVTWTFKR